MAIEPKTSKDREKLISSLQLICREDPTLKLTQDEETGQQIISGMGELHLEIAVHRLENEFRITPRCGEPRVAYRETLAEAMSHEVEFVKELAENTFFAGLKATLTPMDDYETGISVSEKLDRNIPGFLRRAVVKALRDALVTGGNHGYPLIGVEAVVEDLKWDSQKTTEGAVLGAALKLVNEVISRVGTRILTPVMRLELFIPEEAMGIINNELQNRQGSIMEITEQKGFRKILCLVPLASMFGFSKAFPKLTGGRGGFVMEPHGYIPVEQEIISG
ncbi:MAG: hypothetical protein D6820_15440 [Lentisphaerae bacterium]|nr:MAG: hypothetical protein D6820_15440 [Lentisphaerota bacterium]